MISHEVSERRLMPDEQIGFRPTHSMPLQLTRLVESPELRRKRLTCAVFLDVAKDFDPVWIDGLLYKRTLLNFPSYTPYNLIPTGSDFESFFQRARSSRRGMRAGAAQGGMISRPHQYICRHALTLEPRRVSPLRGRHSHHSHVPQARAARQLTGVISQRPSAVVE